MLMASFIIFQIIVFAVLIFMLRKIMTQNVITATQHIDELNQDYTKKDQDISRRLEEVKKQAEEIIRQAQDEALSTRSELLKNAEAQREQLLKQARQKSEEMVEQAEKARHAMLSEIEERVAKEARSKAVELVHDVLPDKFKQNVHNEWVEGLINSGFTHLNNIALPDNVSQISIVSAFPLTAPQRQGLTQKISAVLKRPVTLKEEVDSKLVAGLVVTIASLVFDGTLKNKIMEKAR